MVYARIVDKATKRPTWRPEEMLGLSYGMRAYPAMNPTGVSGGHQSGRIVECSLQREAHFHPRQVQDERERGVADNLRQFAGPRVACQPADGT
jgi:hypothetical protein